MPPDQMDMLFQRFDRIEAKIDGLTACVQDRVTWEAHDRHKAECREEFLRLRGRPSWAVAIILTLLSSAVVGLAIACLSMVR